MNSDNPSVKYFEEQVMAGMLAKIDAGIQVPNFPQFRDMSTMYLDLIEGIEKVLGGFIEIQPLVVKQPIRPIPELTVIRKNARYLSERKGASVPVKLCITGPYTLASYFRHRDPEIFSRLGHALSKILKHNVFRERHVAVTLVTFDEPLFGMMNDPLIDFGSEGRENLLNSWETVTKTIVSSNAKAMVHLHSTADDLFWQITSLNLIDSHVNDSLYLLKRTKKLLEQTDTFLKASICKVDFDTLINDHLRVASQKSGSQMVSPERIAQVWNAINNGKTNPEIFIEKPEQMRKRLDDIIHRFSSERVPFAGPECGLKGFPTFESAQVCLRTVARTIENANQESTRLSLKK